MCQCHVGVRHISDTRTRLIQREFVLHSSRVSGLKYVMFFSWFFVYVKQIVKQMLSVKLNGVSGKEILLSMSCMFKYYDHDYDDNAMIGEGEYVDNL